MEQGVRDHLTSLIDALGVELRIARITIPGIRDGVHMARTAACIETVSRIWPALGHWPWPRIVTSMTPDEGIFVCLAGLLNYGEMGGRVLKVSWKLSGSVTSLGTFKTHDNSDSCVHSTLSDKLWN